MIRRFIFVALLLPIAASGSASAWQDPQLPPEPAAAFAQQRPAPTPTPSPEPPPGQRGAPQPARPATPPPTPPGAPGATPPPALIPPEVRRPRKMPQDVNILVEFTISDQTGSAAPEKKVVSLLAADQTMGQVRASARANRANIGFVGAGLNVDARPMVLDGDRVLVELKLEYTPLLPNQPGMPQEPTNLNESITVILQAGKPLTISQAADPITDRKMTVEVKATILR